MNQQLHFVLQHHFDFSPQELRLISVVRFNSCYIMCQVCYEVGEMVERRDSVNDDWLTGFVTQVDPLLVTATNSVKDMGWPWNEVRKVEACPMQAGSSLLLVCFSRAGQPRLLTSLFQSWERLPGVNWG